METLAAKVAINLIKIKIGSRALVDPIINTETMTNSQARNGNTDLDNTPSKGPGGGEHDGDDEHCASTSRVPSSETHYSNSPSRYKEAFSSSGVAANDSIRN